MSEANPPAEKRPNRSALDVVGVVDDILSQGIAARASDIHFEPTPQGLIVKFRLDGSLKVVEELPAALAENVVARLKVLGGLLTYRQDIPQEGRLERHGDAAAAVIDQRLATFPTIHGQRAVVRLFYEDEGLCDLAGLGLAPALLTGLEDFAQRPQGVLLLTGPAGSGKSTTLAALLRHIQQQFPGKSIITLEDPVERRLAGVTQIQIRPHGQLTFPVALRSLLRQDPEVLMVGEIRDAETARIVIEAGLTGHLLMSTMHSGWPAQALLRLLEMGVEPYQITSAVTAVVNQRLLRRLCPACKRIEPATQTYAAAGCPQCLGTGYRGRLLTAEWVELDGRVRQAILDKADQEHIEAAINQRGHMNLHQDCQRLIKLGLTSPDEQRRVCGPQP